MARKEIAVKKYVRLLDPSVDPRGLARGSTAKSLPLIQCLAGRDRHLAQSSSSLGRLATVNPPLRLLAANLFDWVIAQESQSSIDRAA